MTNHFILIDCTDRKGLIHKITEVLFRHDLNVEDQGEFVDQMAKHFFMRTEVSGVFAAEAVQQEIQAVTPDDAVIKVTPKEKKAIIIMATKEPYCLGDLLIRNAYGELNIEIKAVVSNHDQLRHLVEKFNLPYHYLPHGEESKEEHEAKILEVLRTYQPEYLVLARYMRILGETLLDSYHHRIINIHHSFLPAFAGAKPYHQAFERGVKIIGATAHFVTEELDSGPIIAQNVVPISHTKEVKDMIVAGRNVEKIVLAEALRLVCENRVFIHGNRTVIFD